MTLYMKYSVLYGTIGNVYSFHYIINKKVKLNKISCLEDRLFRDS